MSEAKIVIEDKPEVQEEIVIETEGLSEKEIEVGKKSGVIPEKQEEKKEEVKKEDKKEEPKPKEKAEDKKVGPSSFEEMDTAYEKDEKKFHSEFTPNEKALYFKFKRNKQLRQEAEDVAENLKKERDFSVTKEKAYYKQTAEIEALLDKIDAGEENITTADIRKLIALRKEVKEAVEEKEEEKKEDKPSEEQVKRHHQYLAEKAKNTELLGKSKYENFGELVDLANEVVAKDKEVAGLITAAYHNPEVDEEQLVEKIVRYARLHPDYGKKKDKPGDESKGDKKDIERIVANAQKKKTSASLTSGSGRREVTEDDLTVDDIPRLSQKQWNSLSRKTQERLLKESCS